MHLIDILTPERTVTNISAASKKGTLELASQLLANELAQCDMPDVLHCLIGREKLGSTAIGQGIAIPHCRLKGLQQAMGVLIKLSQPVDFDASDNQPVDIVLALLVPEDANEEHLELLASVAEMFNNDDYRQKIRLTNDNQSLYQVVTHYEQ